MTTNQSHFASRLATGLLTFIIFFKFTMISYKSTNNSLNKLTAFDINYLTKI